MFQKEISCTAFVSVLLERYKNIATKGTKNMEKAGFSQVFFAAKGFPRTRIGDGRDGRHPDDGAGARVKYRP
ncbi:MAG: hypothetical protein LBI87_02595 [Candidatus Accumulibacter sp.]|jgi:hypothetical protein|nr:hypothetical protein [Accumulibacter sp.]